jgi:hypothetical protein
MAIPDDAWEATGWNDPTNDANDRLLAQVNVLGVSHHLEAYRIEERGDGLVCLANAAMEGELMPTLQSLYSGGYSTVTIRGQEYVLFMFPHAA